MINLSPVTRTPIALVYATDFHRMSPGGIGASVEEIVATLGEKYEFILAGIRDQSGKEGRIVLGGRELKLIAIMSAQRRFPRVPLNAVFTLRLMLKRREVVRRARIVHVHRMELAIPFLVRKRRPVLLTIHGASKYHMYCSTGPLRWRLVRYLYEVVEAWVIARVDRVTVVSDESLRYYTGRFPGFAQKFTRIPNALDTAGFHPNGRAAARRALGIGETDPVVVYAGRLSAEKRLVLLVEAFARLSRELHRAHLLLAGDGPRRDSLSALARRLKLANVRFLGQINRSSVPALLSAADVFVLPSVFEGFPMSVLEALGSGVPVVATDVGGVREILQGRLRDFIVDEATPEKFEERMIKAIRERAELEPLCRLQAARFSPQRVLGKFEELYGALLGTHG